jgi:hypothetical protein
MEEYKGLEVPVSTGITIEELREHSAVNCGVIDLCDCGAIECNKCVYDTLAMTVDYLLYKGYIDKAEAMELTLSGIDMELTLSGIDKD